MVAADWATGISASVRAGLAAVARAELVVLHLVDTPDVGADVVERVLGAVRGSGLARATYDGRPGHPVVIARRHWPSWCPRWRATRGRGSFLAGRDDVVAVECGDLATGADVDAR